MKIVEITYRYDGTDFTARPRPADAESARARLEDGSRSISALLDSLTDGTQFSLSKPGQVNYENENEKSTRSRDTKHLRR